MEEGKLGLQGYHFSIIILKVSSGKSDQSMLNIEGNFDEEQNSGIVLQGSHVDRKGKVKKSDTIYPSDDEIFSS